MPTIGKRVVNSKSIWAVTLLVLGIIWVFVIAFFNVYQTDIIEGKRQELIQMNSVVTQHTGALFKSIETDMKVMSWWIRTERSKNPLTDPGFAELVTRLKSNADGLIDIRLVAANGNAYGVPPLTNIPFANVSDRDYFKESIAAQDEQVFVGGPIIARMTGKWIIPISLKLPLNTSGFSLLVVAVDINKLLSIQESWRISKHGSIVLMRDDGILLSRVPFDSKLLGRKITSSRGFTERKLHPQGTYLSEGKNSDGVKRLVSYDYLNQFKLFVSVTRGYDEALASFYKIRSYAFIGTSILTAFLLAAALSMHKSQNILLKSQQNYRQLALVDELTTIMNRRAFMAHAEKTLSTVKQQGEGLAVLMMDIDHFKSINDRFGHAAGDEALKSAAALWRGALRRQDLLGRLGGEEFSVILPSADVRLACDVAERLRLLTEQQSSIGTENCRFSVSIGLAILSDNQEGIQELLKKADKALYLAKQNGRNRVEIYGQ